MPFSSQFTTVVLLRGVRAMPRYHHCLHRITPSVIDYNRLHWQPYELMRTSLCRMSNVGSFPARTYQEKALMIKIDMVRVAFTFIRWYFSSRWRDVLWSRGCACCSWFANWFPFQMCQLNTRTTRSNLLHRFSGFMIDSVTVTTPQTIARYCDQLWCVRSVHSFWFRCYYELCLRLSRIYEQRNSRARTPLITLIAFATAALVWRGEQWDI